MAIQPEAMVTSRTEGARTRFIPKVQLSVIFAQHGSGTDTLEVGTPVAYNTSSGGYVEWATGGANGTDTIQGLVNPEAVVVTDAGEVNGVVMFKGEAHRGDIASAGGTSAQLDTALETVMTLGLIIHALADIRQV